MFCRHVSALLLTIALAAGNVALCAGWLATPEARMACCSEGASCPMHTQHQGSEQGISQAEADSCCAASERGDAAPLSSSFVLSVSLAVIPSPVPFVLPELATSLAAWRPPVPVPRGHIPKHLLLSVLLV